MICPSCKKTMAIGAKFCHECGAPAPVAKPCTSCGRKIAPGKKFCPKCGAPSGHAPAASPKPKSTPPAKSVPKPKPKRVPKPEGPLKMMFDAAAETIACGIDGHIWDGCKCTKCGKIRNEGHRFQPVPGACAHACSACGKIKKKHNFEPVPGKCELKCACGKTRDGHNFQPVPGRCLKQCPDCGQIESIPHIYDNKRRCQRCGQKEPRY